MTFENTSCKCEIWAIALLHLMFNCRYIIFFFCMYETFDLKMAVSVQSKQVAVFGFATINGRVSADCGLAVACCN